MQPVDSSTATYQPQRPTTTENPHTAAAGRVRDNTHSTTAPPTRAEGHWYTAHSSDDSDNCGATHAHTQRTAAHATLHSPDHTPLTPLTPLTLTRTQHCHTSSPLSHIHQQLLSPFSHSHRRLRCPTPFQFSSNSSLCLPLTVCVRTHLPLHLCHSSLTHSQWFFPPLLVRAALCVPSLLRPLLAAGLLLSCLLPVPTRLERCPPASRLPFHPSAPSPLPTSSVRRTRGSAPLLSLCRRMRRRLCRPDVDSLTTALSILRTAAFTDWWCRTAHRLQSTRPAALLSSVCATASL